MRQAESAIERSQLPWEIFAGLFAGKGEPFAVESEAARGPSALRAERRSPDVVGAEARAAGGGGVTNRVGGTNVRDVDPAVANSAHELRPYNPNRPVRDFEADGSTTYVRVYTEGTTGQAGSWMMKADDIAGLSPQQIQNRFDLPNTPTHVTDVKPLQGTTIRTGTVNSVNFGGNGGGTQFELQGRIPTNSFYNPRPLQ